MSNKFIFKGLPYESFKSYFDMSPDELSSSNASLMVVDSNPGYPCRVTLEDAKVGESVIAVSYNYHDVESPYSASGPIFVRKNAVNREFEEGEIPSMLLHRQLSLRAYNSNAFMIEACVIEGKNIEAILASLFKNQEIEYIHAHNAKPGCFNCAVHRA